jgi:PAS domain S-box-containing protein
LNSLPWPPIIDQRMSFFLHPCRRGSMIKSSDFASSALDALSSSISIIDGDGFIIAVNKAWRSFAEANHPQPELVCEGANYFEVCDSAQWPDAAQAAEFAAALRAMISGECAEFNIEYPCHSPGVQRWFCARATIFPGEGSRRLVVAHETITERMLAELELRESEKRYRGLFENSMLGISVTNLEGRLIRANSAYARLYGYESAEEMLREVHDVGLQLYADLEDRKEVLRTLAEDGYMGPREIRVRRRDGSTFHVLVSVREIRDEAGELRGYQADHIDISERKRVEDELRASREQMRSLASRAQATMESERASIARRIHDILSQILTRLKIDLVWLQRRLEKSEQLPSPQAIVPRIAEMIGMTDEAVSTVQRLATELRPAVLDSLGLGAALTWLAWDFQKHGEIACRAFVPEGELEVDKDVATAAFRIAQESLTNVARYSRATGVEIHLLRESESIILSIHDNGVGLDPEKSRDPLSIGIAGMRERARLAGGSLDILSGPASGTTVEASLPLGRSDPRPGGEA